MSESNPQPLIVPHVINGHETRGPSKARPKSCEFGHPFFDEDTNEQLVFSAAGWEVLGTGVSANLPTLPAAPEGEEENEPEVDDEGDNEEEESESEIESPAPVIPKTKRRKK